MRSSVAMRTAFVLRRENTRSASLKGDGDFPAEEEAH
jgi:hypothetical protein